MVTRFPSEEGRKCPKKLERRQKCELEYSARKLASCKSSSYVNGYFVQICRKTRSLLRKGSTYIFPLYNISIGSYRFPEDFDFFLGRLDPCPEDCVLGDWGPWSSCSHSCGEDGTQERVRPVLRERVEGGSECGPRVEQRVCLLAECP